MKLSAEKEGLAMGSIQVGLSGMIFDAMGEVMFFFDWDEFQATSPPLL